MDGTVYNTLQCIHKWTCTEALKCESVQFGRNLPTHLIKVEAVIFFKMMLTTSQPTWCHTLQHRIPHSHCCENLKLYMVNSVLLV
jgi:hypothetical protein